VKKHITSASAALLLQKQVRSLCPYAHAGPSGLLTLVKVLNSPPGPLSGKVEDPAEGMNRMVHTEGGKRGIKGVNCDCRAKSRCPSSCPWLRRKPPLRYEPYGTYQRGEGTFYPALGSDYPSFLVYHFTDFQLTTFSFVLTCFLLENSSYADCRREHKAIDSPGAG
jgi:hypothetical protein